MHRKSSTPTEYAIKEPIASMGFGKLDLFPGPRSSSPNNACCIAAFLDHPVRLNHAFLEHRLALSLSWESVLNGNTLPYLNDHRLKGLVVFPGAAYVEAGLAIYKEVYAKEEVTLENLKFHKALIVEDGYEPVLRLTYDEKTREYTIYSRRRQRSEKFKWVLHATGSFSLAPPCEAERLDLETIQERCYETVDVNTHYRLMASRGLQYGPFFQGVHRLWRRSGEVLAQIDSHKALANEKTRYWLHPALLDACFQSLIATVDAPNDTHEASALYVPVRIRQVCFRVSPPARFWSYGHLLKRTPGVIKGNITLCDDNGKVLVAMHGLCCLRIRLEQGGAENSGQPSEAMTMSGSRCNKRRGPG